MQLNTVKVIGAKKGQVIDLVTPFMIYSEFSSEKIRWISALKKDEYVDRNNMEKSTYREKDKAILFPSLEVR